MRWVDSAHLAGGGWISEHDIEGLHDAETYCETVGFLVYENAHSVYVAGSVAPEEVGGVMQIPKCAVRERRVLTV